MKNLEREIALSRIKRLYGLAAQRASMGTERDRKLSRRYSHIMLEIGRHYKVSLPRGIKNHICTGCGAILVHGSNCSVRISSGNVIYKCGECGKTKRLYRAPT